MKIRIPFLVLSVGQACNLRCQNCGALAPYNNLPERQRYSLISMIEDFETLFKVSWVKHLQIQGGEPLLNKNLHKLIGYLGACYEVYKITVATNGLITPSNELMKVCNAYNVTFRVSHYSHNENNLENFKTKCKDYNVHVEIYTFNTGQDMWYDRGGLDHPREDNDEIVAERFHRCSARGCLTLEDGELHRCSRATNASRLQGFECENDDFVRVRENKNLAADLTAYIAPPPHFVTACRYCNGSDAGMLPPAEQL